ncbi:hypothetical protein OIU77_028574 [Salix suchowensis]|uniref:Uncharacterized protein n=1 Tax=Salix suchowensis TaxID=1278906 RepID=A0ABQ9BHU4_9ROSI|nr:hypothetical protein OIU77_028574 [Salix suchowensis]
MAAANGHLDIVEYLISQGVDINAFNEEKNTPLHWACLNGHTEAVKKLILAGASLGILNSHERTPMDEASRNSVINILQDDKDVKGGFKHLRFCLALTGDAAGGIND